ncbi:DNA primase [Candidatus Trichorickettsia mobilis]|uniref:DNA primase n=1 Tax=Candidatus Trichorickettsia mobilis TaxID=1346319 RepID=A0ABZ0UUD8_9RICK|nr:DNA primase [Candidatus Trichorickettsia mobilis]WPY01216.1 DNA primase [Candidatus Trichorickettsia mobilis]
MNIPIEFYDLLRNRINLSDIVSTVVSLQKRSGEYMGLCPFHTEKSPSFTINNAKRFYHCFGCNAHGDVIKFVSNVSGLSYKEAAIKLAKDYGIDLPKLNPEQAKLYEESEQIMDILELATNFFKTNLNNEVINYLTTRKITTTAIQQFNLGFAPTGRELQKFFASKSIPLMMLESAGLIVKKDNGNIYDVFRNRIIFPIKNIYNRVIGFGGRVIDDSMPKYLNSPETIVFKKSEVLYGENTALPIANKKNYVILVEGYLDVIALNMAGFQEVVATLGTAVTTTHIHKLWHMSDEIVVCLDGDNAGRQATLRLINMILPSITTDKRISFIQLPEGNDPDNIIARHHGNLFFQELLDTRRSLSEMIWDIEYGGQNFTTAEARAGLEAKLEHYSQQIKDRSLSSNYHRFFKDQLWSNLIKRQKNPLKDLSKTKNQQQNLSLLNQGHDYSETEILEHALCAILLRFPAILQHETSRNSLLHLEFSILKLKDFVEWLLTTSSVTTSLLQENIEQIVKNTGFHDTYLLLSKPNGIFSSLLEFEDKTKEVNYLLLWELLCKKYQLLLLKTEYISVLQSGSDDALKKASLYQTEILRTSQELQQLNSSFSNR